MSAMRHAFSLRTALALALIVFTLILPQASAAAPATDRATGPAYVPGEVLIGWEPGKGPIPQVARTTGQFEANRADPAWQSAAAAVSQATGLAVLDAAPEYGTARLSVAPGSESVQIERLKALPWVRYAEPNYYAYAADALYPNDPDFPQQWNLHRIKAAEAWAVTPGSSSITVAVLDTGVDQAHPEFAGRLLPGYNCLPGWCVGGQSAAQDDSLSSHGTHVTGLVAANMGNLQGIAGLAQDVRILPLKVLDGNGSGDHAGIAAAIYVALSSHARVINMSLESPNSTQTLQAAVLEAQRQGALVVAAVGNGGRNVPVYPAAYGGVLAVSASDRFDNATAYSNYGSSVGLAAPGGTIEQPVWSTVRGGYGLMYGTSMSTPLISAAAALVWSLRPGVSASQVADILKNTADKVGSGPYSGLPLYYPNGRNDYFGYGRLNVAKAVRFAYPVSLVPEQSHVGFLLLPTVTSAVQSLEIRNPSGEEVHWQASILPGATWLTVSAPDGWSSYNQSSRLTLRVDSSKLATGSYAGTVRVGPVDPLSGAGAVDVPVQLTIVNELRRVYAPMVANGAQASTWLDPDAPGSLYRSTLSPSDGSLATVELPFAVNYYGGYQQTIQVSENGLVIFGPANGASGATPTTCPGNALAPNNAIYVLANNWDLNASGQIVVHQPDADTFVITWQDVRPVLGASPETFQLVIGSAGTFRANYRSVASPLVGTIGAENYDSIFSQQVLCGNAGQQITSGESVDFAARLPW
jgi:subtilisin family serine protease